MSENKLFNINFTFFVTAVIIICASLLIGLVVTAKTNIAVKKQIETNKEANRPAELDITILQDSDCDDCFDVAALLKALKEENVNINSEIILEISSAEAKELIDRFSIEKVPTFIVKGEIEKNENLKKLWPQVGDIQDGVFVFRQVLTPYILVETGEVKGRVKLTMLNDASCEECYNVTVHEGIMPQFGFPLTNKEILDVNSPSAQRLINRYGIELIPTIVLTGDVDEYPLLKSIWGQVGTIENDGTYVFREGVKRMGVYKNLTSNQILNPVNSN